MDLDFGINVNRLGLKFPQPYGRALLQKEYYRAFDQYIADSFPLRGPLILAKNWLDFHVFRTTDAADVHVGRHGWLYSRRSIADYRKAACGKDAQIGWLVLQLHTLEKIIEASGRRFLFIVAPNKATVYPEFLGLTPEINNCGRSQYDLLVAHLDRHPLKGFVRLDEVMRAAKESQVLLYDKAQAHWNGFGALVAAESIYHRIHDDDFTRGSLDYVSSSGDQPGDLAAQLMGLAAAVMDRPFRQLAGSNRPDFPAGILYGDFFQRNLFPYMVQMFKQLDVVQADRIPSIQHKENWHDYDYILIESAESELGTLYLELDTIYSMLEGEAQIARRITLDLTTVAPVSHTSLRSRSDGLEIKSLGTQSAFDLKAVPASDHNTFRVLKLTLGALQSDRMTIQYQTPLRFAAAKTIKPGRTEFYLPLPFQESVSLRFYPGDKAGLFVLQSAEIIEFSDNPGADERPWVETASAVEASKNGVSLSDESPITNIFDLPDDFDIPMALPMANVIDLESDEMPPMRVETASAVEASKDGVILTDESPTTTISDLFDIPVDMSKTGLTDLESDEKPPAVAANFSSFKYINAEINPEDETAAIRPERSDLLPESQIKPELSSEVKVHKDLELIVKEIVPEDIDRKQPNRVEPDLSEREQGAAPDEAGPEAADPIPTPTPDIVVAQAGNDVKDNKARPIHIEVEENPRAIESSIAVNDFEDGRIFQRQGRSADIMVSGTYTGSAGTIEARVVKDGGFEEVVPWTIIDNTPQNGIFVGVLADVPQGGWYNLQVRLGRAHAVSNKGSHKWGVGILIACLGQSNMKEWFHAGDSLKANSLIRKYTDKGWSSLGTRGNGAIAFGNRLVERLGISVGLLDYSENGSGLCKKADWGTGYWENTAPGSIYNRFVAGVTKTGGALEYVIWFQGEADAARKTVTETEYRDSLESFITNQVRADIDNGSDREHLPFLVVMLTKRPGGRDEPHQAIRNAQKQVAENLAECYLAATTLDLKNRGKQHMHPEAYTTMGRRVAQTVLYVLGKAQYYRGPTAIAARQINDRRIDVSIQHRGGADFTPASGISGWEILVNETALSIADVKRHDSSTIRIILENPLTENATVRYLYGAVPDTRNPVADNSALSLPLEEYQSQVQ